MRTYITCIKRKGNPKIPVEVCRHTCKHRRKCEILNSYQNPPLFPELESPPGRMGR